MPDNNANNAVRQPNCWDCKYNDLTGVYFFGRCTWFEKHGKGENKTILRKIVDKGCKFYVSRK